LEEAGPRTTHGIIQYLEARHGIIAGDALAEEEEFAAMDDVRSSFQEDQERVAKFAAALGTLSGEEHVSLRVDT
jgi:hypothetical protein